jgi:restriction endonuclease S subunit
MARIDDTHHQITFEVGQQLNPENVNFKFFHQNSFGNGDNEEFTPFTNPKITTTSDVFYINFNTPDRGNVKLRSGKTLTSGDIYVLTIDTSDTSHVILSTENITTGMEDVSTRRTSHEGVCYDITGKKMGGIAPGHHDRQGQKQIIIVDGKKIVR